MPNRKPARMTPAEMQRAISERITRIRLRPGRAKTLNESHARELVARKIVLPLLKEKLGQSLKAVVILGSAQLGIRKASAEDTASDLDIKFIVSHEAEDELLWQHVVNVCNLIKAQCDSIGVDVHLLPDSQTQFLRNEKETGMPFQAIFGEEWLREKLGADFLKKAKTFRERLQMRKHFRYTERE